MKLFKYTTWDPGTNNCYTQQNLLNSQLFFNSPEQFNDPFDTLPLISAKRDKERLIRFGTKVVMDAENAPKKIAKKKATHKVNTDPRFKDDDAVYNTATESFSRLRSRMGVCCFTTNCPELILMWAHYADKHKGICLEFDFPDNGGSWKVNSEKINREMFISPFLPMTYSYKIPSWNVLTDDGSGIHTSIVTKSKEWEYENEIRLVCNKYTGLLKYNELSLRAIYAGCKMNDSKFNELKSTIKKLHFQPRLYRMQINKEKYALDAVHIIP